GPAEGGPDHCLLLRGLHERLQRALRVLAVLLLGLDVDVVELQRLLGDALPLEALVDQRGAVRPPGNLELETEPEAAESLLEGRAPERAEPAGGADRGCQRVGLRRVGLGDAQAIQRL